MKIFHLLAICSYLFIFSTAANIPNRPPGALLVFNDDDFVYLPTAETENPAQRVFESPKVVNKAVVAASPLRYQDIAGTGLYKCILHVPIKITPTPGIFEMRGSVFSMNAYNIETMTEEPIEVDGATCYVLPRDGSDDYVAVWVNEEQEDYDEELWTSVGSEEKQIDREESNGEQEQMRPTSPIGTLIFVKIGSMSRGAADPSSSQVTMFEEGPRTLKVAQVIDWTGRDEHMEPSLRRPDSDQEPFCRLVGESGRTTGFTYTEPLYIEDSVPDTYVGVECSS